MDGIGTTRNGQYMKSFVTDIPQLFTKSLCRPWNLRSDNLNLSTGTPGFSTVLVSSNHL